jgi:hypothetical protein
MCEIRLENILVENHNTQIHNGLSSGRKDIDDMQRREVMRLSVANRQAST